jgi:hypothetical protein
MQMSAADQKAYPKTAYYVRKNLPDVIHVPLIVSALKSIGEMDTKRIRIALQWGHGPTVKVSSSLGTAYGVHYPGKHELHVNKSKVIDPFENGKGLAKLASGAKVYVLGVTILHELVHWGDWQNDGKKRPNEAGEEFENKVYKQLVW